MEIVRIITVQTIYRLLMISMLSVLHMSCGGNCEGYGGSQIFVRVTDFQTGNVIEDAEVIVRTSSDASQVEVTAEYLGESVSNIENQETYHAFLENAASFFEVQIYVNRDGFESMESEVISFITKTECMANNDLRHDIVLCQNNEDCKYGE